MSNLGGYQWLTTTAKKVGGPRNLVLIIAGAGAVVYKSSEVLLKIGVNVFKRKSNEEKIEAKSDITIYTVKSSGISNEGLVFEVGELFKVLESDGDAVLIEKIGDNNNPYFVSAELLEKISDYKK